jgi:hypothetical protein
MNGRLSCVSRRGFLGLGAAAAAASFAARPLGAQALPNEQPPNNGPDGQSPRFAKTKLWVQITTGGKPYPPSFMNMFLDPIFMGIEMWPIDQPTTFAALLPQGAGRAGGGRGAGAAGGGGRAGAASAATPPAPVTPLNGAPGPGASSVGGGTERLEPADYPWEPSGGRPHPGYDVLLLNDQVDWPEMLQTQIKQAVDLGRGIVVLHHALGDNQSWPWWSQEVTGGMLVLADQSGAKKSTVTHASKIDVKPVGTHPIVRNLVPFSLADDEVYKGMWQSPKIHPLLETANPASDKTMAWIGVHPTAKVVCIQPGGSRTTHQHPSYRLLVRNALMWAGGRLI